MSKIRSFVNNSLEFFGDAMHYRMTRTVKFAGSLVLDIAYNCYRILVWLGIAYWVYLNNGHIRQSNNISSTVGLQIKEGFTTNYSDGDFNETYVKPYERKSYNRQWENTDFAFKFPSEIQVMTNMVITANQTFKYCPESPYVSDVECDKNVSNPCVIGFKRPHGQQTGRCVTADFPWPDKHGKWTLLDVCQVRGWCPVDRILPPLVDYNAVLVETKNTTLWIKSTVFFPEYNAFVDNMININKTLNYYLQCRYNPHTAPYCPVFILGDIIANTQNNNNSYEEIAKFGATIVINIKWHCNAHSFEWCKPIYSFVRTDNENTEPVTGYTSYRYPLYFDYGNTRTFVRSYRIRFMVKVEGVVYATDYFSFFTKVFAYSVIFNIAMRLFGFVIKKICKRYFVRDVNRLDMYAYDSNNEEMRPLLEEDTIAVRVERTKKVTRGSLQHSI